MNCRFFIYRLVKDSNKSFFQIKEEIIVGKTSCVELVNQYLAIIEEKNSILNAFVAVYAEEAKARAIDIDLKIKNNTAGRLAGMVIGIKDVLCLDNHGLQAGSKILDGFESKFTSSAIQRLIDEDVIIIGRQNCDEFAMGSSNENSAFGPVKNAFDITKVPGGSSGGSAVAVQAGMCCASIGSDTGGSVRQPAAFCGLVGLKPTYGRISRWGLIAYGSSFDCIGPIANSVEDVALLLEIMAGSDNFDSTVSSRKVEKYTEFKSSNKKYKIGYLEEGINSEGVQEEIKAETRKLLDELENSGHQIKPFKFELIDAFLPTYYILTTAEASSNLSRFDGVRYGHRTNAATDLENLYKKSRSEGFGKEVKKRIMLGTFVLSASYYDAYYTKAQKVRKLIQNKTNELFKDFDFIIMPTTPTAAFKIGDKTSDSLQMYLADIFTVQANVTGFPAISIPRGKDQSEMPIGIQVMSKPFDEAVLLNFVKDLVKKD